MPLDGPKVLLQIFFPTRFTRHSMASALASYASVQSDILSPITRRDLLAPTQHARVLLSETII